MQIGSKFLGSLLCTRFPGLHLTIELLWWVLERPTNHVENPRIVGLEETSNINSTLQQNILQWLPMALKTRSKCQPHHAQPSTWPTFSFTFHNPIPTSLLLQNLHQCCLSVCNAPPFLLTPISSWPAPPLPSIST